MSEYIKQRALYAANIVDIHGMTETEEQMFITGYEMGARFIKGLYEGVWVMGDGIETAEQLIDAVNKRIEGES